MALCDRKRQALIECRKIAVAGMVWLSGISVLGADTVKFGQAVKLESGWNAIYLNVAPDCTADELFADWPVDFVGVYDPAAFRQTRQYSGAASSEGSAESGYKVWYRSGSGVSTIAALPGNAICVCFATNAMAAKMIYGRPVAPAITWHRTSSEDAMNFVGISSYGETTIADYLNGCDVDNTEYKIMWGVDRAAPKFTKVYGDMDIGNGAVILADSSKVSDWSGVLNVSPASGIDFGDETALATLIVRNDGALARTVQVALDRGIAAELGDIPPIVPGLMIKDATTVAAAATNEWAVFSNTAPWRGEIEAGQTVKLQIALDRNQLSGVAGTYYGGLLKITDVDGGSAMQVTLPIEATSDGGKAAANAWPKGIWLASAALDTITFVGTPVTVTNTVLEVTNIVDSVTGETMVVTNEVQREGVSIPTTEVPAGGTMKVRLPLYVDREGAMTLLQRFWYGRDAEGKLHVIAGSETSDVKLAEPRRVSTAFLPTDQVKVPATSGSFGTTAGFRFTVGETSNVNPMRHALHPQHDGKRFDFETPSPSGDDFENYAGTIKPESFSITNTVEFVWDGTTGTAWNPEETLHGTLVWEFDGLRHEGTLRARGKFTMKRISSASVEK